MAQREETGWGNGWEELANTPQTLERLPGVRFIARNARHGSPYSRRHDVGRAALGLQPAVVSGKSHRFPGGSPLPAMFRFERAGSRELQAGVFC